MSLHDIKVNMIFRVLGESKVFLRAIVSERALAGKLLIPPVTNWPLGCRALSRGHLFIYEEKNPTHLRNPVIASRTSGALPLRFPGTH